MGLRLREGVDLSRLEALAGGPVIDMDAAARLTSQGLLAREDDRLRATSAGIILLDAILAELAA